MARVPAPLATLTTRPRARANIPGNSARVQSSGPRRLTSTHRHQSSGSVSASGPTGPPMPALLTSRSIGPSRLSTSATAASTAARSVTSAGHATARPPDRVTCPTVSANWSMERASTATAAPASARAVAMARPIPRPPPVTKATWPDRSLMDPSRHHRHHAHDAAAQVGVPLDHDPGERPQLLLDGPPLGPHLPGHLLRQQDGGRRRGRGGRPLGPPPRQPGQPPLAAGLALDDD